MKQLEKQAAEKQVNKDNQMAKIGRAVAGGAAVGLLAGVVFLLKPDLLATFSKGCVNLHAAYLPWNRGWHTNVWPILDGSPAGVTLLYIDEGVDTGDLITQRAIPVGPTDTGGSLHERLTLAIIDLFKETWPEIVAGREIGRAHV